MTAIEPTFDARLRKIVRNHQRMSNGVVGRMGPDGLVRPVARRAMPQFPLRGVVLMFFVALVFKAYVLNTMGGAEYQSRIDGLSRGTLLEQAGAFVMQADPITLTVADMVRTVTG